MNRQQEEVTLHDRRFLVTVEGPDEVRRFSAMIRETSTGRLLTRTPVRGRSPTDARDRALEVLHNLVMIERLQEEIVAVAAILAPGARVDLTEDAQAIHADLAGPWTLGVPFSIPRDDITDPTADLMRLRDRIHRHFQTHLRRAGD